MYIFRQDVECRKFKQKEASETIGIAAPTLSNILLGKVACRKVVAYCITKYIDENAEIEDYFIRKEN